jgi:hypothetical protein
VNPKENTPQTFRTINYIIKNKYLNLRKHYAWQTVIVMVQVHILEENTIEDKLATVI